MNNNLRKIYDTINNLEERLDWDSYFMSLALLISNRSPSTRLKVGSVIVKDKRVISSGYNGFTAGAPHVSIMRDGHEINTIHSEQNSISDTAKRGIPIENSTIYITHFPCINCSKLIMSSGIKKIIYLDDYKNDEVVPILLKESGIDIIKFKSN